MLFSRSSPLETAVLQGLPVTALGEQLRESPPTPLRSSTSSDPPSAEAPLPVTRSDSLWADKRALKPSLELRELLLMTYEP